MWEARRQRPVAAAGAGVWGAASAGPGTLRQGVKGQSVGGKCGVQVWEAGPVATAGAGVWHALARCEGMKCGWVVWDQALGARSMDCMHAQRMVPSLYQFVLMALVRGVARAVDTWWCALPTDAGVQPGSSIQLRGTGTAVPEVSLP